MYIYDQKLSVTHPWLSERVRRKGVGQPVTRRPSQRHEVFAWLQQSSATGNQRRRALGGIGRGEQDVVLTAVENADKLTNLSPQVSANLKLMKWGVHHAARYIRDAYKIDRSYFISNIGLLATSGGYEDYPRRHVDRLLRRTNASIGKTKMTIKEIEDQHKNRRSRQGTSPSLRRGVGIWCTLDTQAGSKVIVGLGPPPRGGFITGLHEGMHALSNPQGLGQNQVLAEGGAEYFARLFARGQGLTYEKRYLDQEALLGKLVTDFGAQMMAEAFFGDGLPAFEKAFDIKYGSGSHQRFINFLEEKRLMRAATEIGLDYETMDSDRP